jgi:hypothetical protein
MPDIQLVDGFLSIRALVFLPKNPSNRPPAGSFRLTVFTPCRY